MRDLEAPVLLLLRVGWLRVSLIIGLLDGIHDLGEVLGAAQRGDEAWERLDRGRRHELRDLAHESLQNAAGCLGFGWPRRPARILRCLVLRVVDAGERVHGAAAARLSSRDSSLPG